MNTFEIISLFSILLMTFIIGLISLIKKDYKFGIISYLCGISTLIISIHINKSLKPNENNIKIDTIYDTIYKSNCIHKKDTFINAGIQTNAYKIKTTKNK